MNNPVDPCRARFDPGGKLNPLDVVDRLLLRLRHVVIARNMSTHCLSLQNTQDRRGSSQTRGDATQRSKSSVAPLTDKPVGTQQEVEAAVRVQSVVRGNEKRQLAGELVLEKEVSRFRKEHAGSFSVRDDDDGFDVEFETLDDGAMRNPQAITLDAAVTLKLSFSQRSKLYFKLKLDLLFAPTLSFRIKWIKLDAKVRIIYDLYRGKLLVGFIDEPIVKWDIELRVGVLHLPDWLEDSLRAS